MAQQNHDKAIRSTVIENRSQFLQQIQNVRVTQISVNMHFEAQICETFDTTFQINFRSSSSTVKKNLDFRICLSLSQLISAVSVFRQLFLAV